MTEQPAITGPIHRRVNAIFGDSKPENYYYKPKKITDEALMDVCLIFRINRSIIFFFFFLE